MNNKIEIDWNKVWRMIKNGENVNDILKKHKDSRVMSFHGSRSLDHQAVKKYIKEAIDEYKPQFVITHGEPAGACRLVRDYCREKAISLKLCWLDRERYGRGAFHCRSIEVLAYSDIAVFLWDGTSKGTTNEYKYAKVMKKKRKLYEIEPYIDTLDADILDSMEDIVEDDWVKIKDE